MNPRATRRRSQVGHRARLQPRLIRPLRSPPQGQHGQPGGRPHSLRAGRAVHIRWLTRTAIDTRVSCSVPEVENEPVGGAPFDEAQARRRIAEIIDELTVVPRTDIGRRSALRAERDALSAQLRAVSADAHVARRWAERATPRPASPPAHIPSHSEGGGS